MKKSIITVLFILFGVYASAQTSDSVFIYKSVDEMTDETFYFPSRKIVCSSGDSNLSFSISFFIDQNKDSSFSVSDLYVRTSNYGCVEDVEVIFLFEDGSKVNCKSWNDFNCDDQSYCTVSKEDQKIMASKKLTKIRVINNRNMKSYTATIGADSQDYFIQFFIALNAKKVENYTEE